MFSFFRSFSNTQLNNLNYSINYDRNNHRVTVLTHPTISLVKYFGVRCESLRLPARSSFALSLAELTTLTTVSFKNEKGTDSIWIEGYDDDQGITMIRAFIEKFRQRYGISDYFNVISKNNFPTASGLASSGSGFAALSIALAKLCQLNLSKKELSAIARFGSGSAARSIYSGMMFWHRGDNPGGEDCFAETIFSPDYWPALRMIVVITSEKSKLLSTRNAGKMIVKSPGYKDWADSSEERISLLINAIRDKNINTVGSIMEQDCVEMHNCLKQVGISYHTKESLLVMNSIKLLREEKINCYYTSDAGPQIKVLCLEHDVELIIERVTECVPKVRCIVSKIGGEPIIESTMSHRDSEESEIDVFKARL